MQVAEHLVAQAAQFADDDKPDEAMEIVNRVLLDDADNAGALYVAGCVMLGAGRHVQAIQMAKRVTETKPRDPRGWGLLALCYGELHKYDDSIRHAERALALRRDCKTLADAAYAHVNAGNWELGDRYSKESLACNDGKRDDAMRDARIHQMYCRLALGDWQAGFKEYRLTLRTKWRKEREYVPPDGAATVEWNGEPDAVVMVTGEQGVGDEIMAASVIPDADKACKRFIFDCDHRLAALFRRSFPNVLVVPTRRNNSVILPTDARPTHHKSLFGLAELFRKSDADFPRAAYLKADPLFVRMFRSYFPPGPLIGLAWSGGLPRTGQEQRQAGLNAFLPLIRAGGATFVSLQYKDDGGEIAAFERQYNLTVHRMPWVAQGQDLDVLAGLIASCDEVIGVATAALHMSSALGVPSTIITNRGLGWAFQRPEMMWYPPTTQLHRKQTGESWRDAVARLVEQRKGRKAA